MYYTALLMVAALGQSPITDPVELVGQLGSARFSQREAASARLESLGKAALPALRFASDGKDPEIRSRALTLLSRIEGAILTQPSSVALHFQETPIQEVIKSLSEQSGMKLVLLPQNSPSLRNRRITLEQVESVTFWKALDLLSDAGRLQFNYGPHVSTGGKGPEFPLYDGGSRLLLPSFDTGPFRVVVRSYNYHHMVNYTGGQNGDGTRLARKPETRRPEVGSSVAGYPTMVQENCQIQIQIVAEPRLSIGQNGLMRLTRAVDNKGQSWIALADPGSVTIPESSQSPGGYFGFSSGSVLQIQAPLIRPDSPGDTIKTLTGVVSVAVSSRKPNPLVALLKGTEGKTFQNKDASLTVHGVQTVPVSRQKTIDVSFHTLLKSGSSAAGEQDAEVLRLNRPDLLQRQIDVIDGQGRSMMWYPSNFDGESGRITMTLSSPDPSATPSELRYFGIVKATTNVSFEFHDLPLHD